MQRRLCDRMRRVLTSGVAQTTGQMTRSRLILAIAEIAGPKGMHGRRKWLARVRRCGAVSRALRGGLTSRLGCCRMLRKPRRAAMLLLLKGWMPLVCMAWQISTVRGGEATGSSLPTRPWELALSAAPLVGKAAPMLESGAAMFGPTIEGMAGRYPLVFGPRLNIVPDGPAIAYPEGWRIELTCLTTFSAQMDSRSLGNLAELTTGKTPCQLLNPEAPLIAWNRREQVVLLNWATPTRQQKGNPLLVQKQCMTQLCIAIRPCLIYHNELVNEGMRCT